MQNGKFPSGWIVGLALSALATLTMGTRAAAQTEKVLYSFNNNGKDGNFASGALIFDSAGNLYGTTAHGGLLTCGQGCGTVFELTPMAGGGWEEKVLHNFDDNGKDGYVPLAGGLIFDASGNLYGMTAAGGDNGFGTVFELTPKSGGWGEKILHIFGSTKDGNAPFASLIFDAAGNLYGTTAGGGFYGGGTVFELTPKSGGWGEKILHNFSYNGYNEFDGVSPYAGLIFDVAGNLYGTTYGGGVYGNGTVFELTPKTGGWAEKILHNFGDGAADGINPRASLIFDAAGNLYGTTFGGGGTTHGEANQGTVFELTPTSEGWSEKILHVFHAHNAGSVDGYNPSAGLIFDAAGNLYGTTRGGGAYRRGTVFELTPTEGGTWTETVLHSFNGADGQLPHAGLIFDGSGNLYGTTSAGGVYGNGTVFEITP